jgi:opacity protein-like surface antigen
MVLASLIAASLFTGAPYSATELDTPLPSPLTSPYEYSDPTLPVDAWYLRLGAGWVSSRTEDSPNGGDIDFDDGWMGTIGVGKRVGAWDTGVGFSVELDGLYASQDADDGPSPTGVQGQDTAAVFVDGIFDLRFANQFSVFAGAGLGLAFMDVDADSGFKDEDGPFFAWQAKAGVAWHLSPTTSLSLGYRFVDVDDDELEDNATNASSDIDTRLHGFELGLMFGV